MTTRARDYFGPGPRQQGRVAALVWTCNAWKGTPFRARSAVMGAHGGVDCAGFVGSVFLQINAIDAEIAVPPYTINHAEHSDESLLRAWFEQPHVRARVRLLDEGEPDLPGDMVFPKVGRTEHHLALQVRGEIYHVVRPAGVCCQTLAGLALHKVTLHRSRYRLLEK